MLAARKQYLAHNRTQHADVKVKSGAVMQMIMAARLVIDVGILIDNVIGVAAATRMLDGAAIEAAIEDATGAVTVTVIPTGRATEAAITNGIGAVAVTDTRT